MPGLKTALQATALTTVLASTFIYNRTKQSKIISPLSPNDPIFFSKHYLKNNPHKNPSVQDICVRKVPASKIKPGLVEAFLAARGNEGEGKEGVRGVVENVKGKVENAVKGVDGKQEGPEFGLIEGFCAGVWGGLGEYLFMSLSVQVESLILQYLEMFHAPDTDKCR